MRDMFIHLLQTNTLNIIMFLGVVWLILSGLARSTIQKLKKLKAGPIELDLAYASTEEGQKQIRDNFKSVWAKQEKFAQDVRNAEALAVEAGSRLELAVADIKNEIKTLTELVQELSIDQLKLVFYNDRMPKEEQLIAGMRYVSRGHNGHTKKEVLQFAKANIEMYKSAVYAVPALRLSELDKF